MKMRIFLVLSFASLHLTPFHTLTNAECWGIFERRKSGISFRKLRLGRNAKLKEQKKWKGKKNYSVKRSTLLKERKKEPAASQER
jgi:hypothetical protein